MSLWIIALLAIILLAFLWYIIFLRKRLKDLLLVLKDIKNGDNRKVFTQEKGIVSEIGFEINTLVSEYREELTKQKRLEQANKELVTSLSHDVRTPLTSLLGYLDALESGVVEGEEKEQYIKTAHKKAYDLKKLVDTLFDWFKIDSKEMQLVMEKIDINELTREILIDWIPVFTEKGIEPKAEIPEDEYIVKVDKSAYTRIVSNIIQNAVEHGDASCIGIIVESENNMVKIIISNNGVEIDKGKLPHIFDRLYKGDSARGRHGSGLGLFIAKELTKLQGGNIFVESKKGENTSFIITLPIIYR